MHALNYKFRNKNISLKFHNPESSLDYSSLKLIFYTDALSTLLTTAFEPLLKNLTINTLWVTPLKIDIFLYSYLFFSWTLLAVKPHADQANFCGSCGC